jgi:hypothetical protein
VKYHEKDISYFPGISFIWDNWGCALDEYGTFFLKPKQCRIALKFCDAVNEACGADECTQIFPGDGYTDPSFGTTGHGPALSYTDNGDLTATDDNTKFMWEVKLAADGSDGGDCDEPNQADRSVHCVNNQYQWSSSGSAADGTLFTVFLDTLNNKCDGDETTSCTMDSQCTGIGNGLCGHAGFRDWFIPNAKQLQSIVDYGTFNPAIDSTFPGATASFFYWSATTNANGSNSAWFVNFDDGDVNVNSKIFFFHARGVRPCP